MKNQKNFKLLLLCVWIFTGIVVVTASIAFVMCANEASHYMHIVLYGPNLDTFRMQMTSAYGVHLLECTGVHAIVGNMTKSLIERVILFGGTVDIAVKLIYTMSAAAMFCYTVAIVRATDIKNRRGR